MNRTVCAIDPGDIQSAFVVWNPDGNGGLGEIIVKGIWPNGDVFNWLVDNAGSFDVLAFEMVACYGMPVGRTIFETVFWIGRFYTAGAACIERARVTRQTIKNHHCQSMRANDANVRQCLIDKYGEPGTKAKPGITYGLKKDLWAAFALATYWTENNKETRKVYDGSGN